MIRGVQTASSSSQKRKLQRPTAKQLNRIAHLVADLRLSQNSSHARGMRNYPCPDGPRPLDDDRVSVPETID